MWYLFIYLVINVITALKGPHCYFNVIAVFGGFRCGGRKTSAWALYMFLLVHRYHPISLRKDAHAIYCNFHGCKNASFQLKFFDYFYIFAQNIDCGYTQFMFWSNNKKKMNTPVNPSFTI